MGFEGDMAIQEDTWYSLGWRDLGSGDGSGDRSSDESGDLERREVVKMKIGVQDRNMTPFLESCYHATSKVVGVPVVRKEGSTQRGGQQCVDGRTQEWMAVLIRLGRMELIRLG